MKTFKLKLKIRRDLEGHFRKANMNDICHKVVRERRKGTLVQLSGPCQLDHITHECNSLQAMSVGVSEQGAGLVYCPFKLR